MKQIRWRRIQRIRRHHHRHPKKMMTRTMRKTRRLASVGHIPGRTAGVLRVRMMPSVAKDTRIIPVIRPPWRITRNIR